MQWILFNCAPQPAYVHIERACVSKVVSFPHMFDKVLARYCAAGTIQQHLQQLGLFRRQAFFLIPALHSALFDTYSQWTDMPPVAFGERAQSLHRVKHLALSEWVHKRDVRAPF